MNAIHISSAVPSPQRTSRGGELGFGIVEDGHDVDARAARQRYGLRERVVALPVEIPVVDVDERCHRPIGIGRGDLHLSAEQVHMGRHADGVQVCPSFPTSS